MIGPTSADSMYTITLHQPWASLIALGIKTVETRSWPAPARLVGQTLPVGAVLATVTLAGMARVEYVDPMTGYAIHDGRTEIGCAAGLGWTQTDPWGDFSPGRWLWFLGDVRKLPERVPAVGHQSFWRWEVSEQPTSSGDILRHQSTADRAFDGDCCN